MEQASFSLKEIANWAEEGSKFSLPNVQRGFVWKPYQIEDLWDSILRGYPIGCFVLSKSFKTNEESFEILDGQQRATSISLGFAAKTFRNTDQNVRLFIDLDFTKSDEDERKFLFRVITKSQPWGYEKRNNSTTLDADRKRKAMAVYGFDDHLDIPLDKFFPFDSLLPVPFSFLLHAKSVEEAIQDINSWPLFVTVKKHFLENKTNFNADDFDKYLNSKINNILRYINVMYLKYANIPALYPPINEIIENENPEDNIYIENAENNSSDKSADEIENLFIRLNSSGTPLRGEELNYSILKAHINKQLQEEIEKACEYFVKPSRFIAILFRVYSNEPNSKSIGNISLKIKPKVFQRTIASDKSAFAEYIQKVLSDKVYDGKTLLEYIKYILSYEPNDNTNGFPFIVYSRFADRAPELMLALFFRIKVMEDRFEPSKRDMLRNELHCKMLGTFSLFYWVGKGERIRDYTKLLRNIWPSVSRIKNTSEFWSSATVNRAMIKDVMSCFPKSTGKYGLTSFFQNRIHSSRVGNRNTFILNEDEESLESFINATINNKDLVAYAQREFLHSQFLPIHYSLEDTNVPFDWDHISPQNAIAIRPIPKPIASVYETVGNYRAWPFYLNRGDQDLSPSKKFNPLTKSDESFQLTQYGKKLKIKIQNISSLNKALLDASICDKDWGNLIDRKLKKPNEWKPVYFLILKRCLKIYQIWYNNLLIDKLHPINSKVNFENLFYAGKWNRNSDKDLKEDLNFNEYDNFFSKPILPNIYLYFSYKRGNEFEEEKFGFGLFEKDPFGKFSNLIIEDKSRNIYVIGTINQITFVDGFFTLISTESSSYKILLEEIAIWIKGFPDKTIKKAIMDFFTKSLKKEHNEYFAKK